MGEIETFYGCIKNSRFPTIQNEGFGFRIEAVHEKISNEIFELAIFTTVVSSVFLFTKIHENLPFMMLFNELSIIFIALREKWGE